MPDKQTSEPEKYLQCPACQGEGKIPIGEHLVTLDMAIDAGDRSMEGAHHSFEYGECDNCKGTGQGEISPAWADYMEAREKKLTRLAQETYQIVAILAECGGEFDSHPVVNALDKLTAAANQDEIPDIDLLPFMVEGKLRAENEQIVRENIRLREAVARNNELRELVRDYYNCMGTLTPPEKRMLHIANTAVVAPSPAHKNT